MVHLVQEQITAVLQLAADLVPELGNVLSTDSVSLLDSNCLHKGIEVGRDTLRQVIVIGEVWLDLGTLAFPRRLGLVVHNRVLKLGVGSHERGVLALVLLETVLIESQLGLQVLEDELAAGHGEDAINPLAELGGNERVVLEEVIGELVVEAVDHVLNLLDDGQGYLLRLEVVELVRADVGLSVAEEFAHLQPLIIFIIELEQHEDGLHAVVDVLGGLALHFHQLHVLLGEVLHLATGEDHVSSELRLLELLEAVQLCEDVSIGLDVAEDLNTTHIFID